jgi:quercetin dioxygenase-like cupin family protein
MNRSSVFCATLFLSMSLFAQSAGEVDITAEPHHHQVLQNQYVRVFQVEVPPHQATLLHRHTHDYVYVTLGDCQLENDVAGKPPVMLKLKDGQTNFTPGNFAHLVKVPVDVPFRNVTVELMQDEKNRDVPESKWDQGRGLDILSNGTQDVLFIKDDVRVSDVQLQPGAMLPKHHHPGPQLLVAVSDLELRTSPVGQTSTPIEMKAGEVKWIPAGPAHTLMNLGKGNARLITLEFRDK